MQADKKDIGRRVAFKAATRANCVQATRKIKGITEVGGVEVRYNGWDMFRVRPHEILRIFDKEAHRP